MLGAIPLLIPEDTPAKASGTRQDKASVGRSSDGGNSTA